MVKLKLRKVIKSSGFTRDMEKRVSSIKPTIEIPPELEKKQKRN